MFQYWNIIINIKFSKSFFVNFTLEVLKEVSFTKQVIISICIEIAIITIGNISNFLTFN